MICYRPLRVKVFYKDGSMGHEMVPCGKCYMCLRMRQKDWVNRMILEQKSSQSCYFVTITYDDYNVPHNKVGGLTLLKSDLQKFIKRLRKAYDLPLRYFACGEYGTNTCRPHYHICFFLQNSCDIEVFDEFVKRCWSFGFSSTSNVTESRMAYTAKYCLKSFQYPEHSEKPFILMSRKPGIGGDYLSDQSVHDYHFDHPYLVVQGHKERLPRYYREHLAFDKSGVIPDRYSKFMQSDSRFARVRQFEDKMENYKSQNETL